MEGGHPPPPLRLLPGLTVPEGSVRALQWRPGEPTHDACALQEELSTRDVRDPQEKLSTRDERDLEEELPPRGV